MARPVQNLGNPPILSIVVSLAGPALVAFADLTKQVRLPQRGKIVGVDLNVAGRGGTHSTSTVDLKVGSTSLLAAAFDVAALTPGTVVTKESAALAAGAADVAAGMLNIVIDEGSGSSPTWQGADLQIDYVPLGGTA